MFDTQSQVRTSSSGRPPGRHLRKVGKQNRKLTWLPMEAGGGRSATSKGNRRQQNRREQCTASGPVEKDEPLLGEQFGDYPESLNPRSYN